MKIITLFFLLFFNIAASTYSIKPGSRPKSAIDNLRFHNIADFYNIPQNTSYYAKQIEPISYSEQLNDAKNYIKRFFAPWSYRFMHEKYNTLTWQIKMAKRRTLYGFNKRPISKKLIKYWIKNSNFKALNSIKAYAISIKHSNLKAFPTNKDIYLNPNKSTAYYPFDYNQNSEIHPGVPLYISHYSLDKKWAFVKAAHTFGWIKLSDIALVNNSFKMQYKRANYAVVIKDNSFIYKDNTPYSILKLGTIFPALNGKILIPIKDKNGFAKIAFVNKNSLLAKFPIKFNRKNVAFISQQFVNEPYGWGGKAFCRDCSATTRDFFAPFGVFLSRNSANQAKEGKRVINIKGLPKKIKKALIIKYAKPFRSLLYVPGHITIYIGEYKNEPVVMHTYWGIRLNNWSKYTLSRTIITTTEPGKEHPNIREKSKLINSLQKIIIY